ncbi:hypothetical protein D5086_020514 [Populus alba]|uniref:Uncharacterized protein n=1 Tax=Populus alba TaxID=43335 RepID=A0ACC4BKW7_POPAL
MEMDMACKISTEVSVIEILVSLVSLTLCCRTCRFRCEDEGVNLLIVACGDSISVNVEMVYNGVVLRDDFGLTGLNDG